MNLIIFGPPGTGKGTQAERLARHYKLHHISTGALFRQEYAKKTMIGIAAAQYWHRGKLVPKKILLPLVEKNLPHKDFMLDGFPRTITQARWLAHHRTIDKAIYLKSDKKTAVQRLLRRAQIEGRKDDTLPVIKKRFELYERRQIKPLLRYYHDRLLTVDGNGSIPRISRTIVHKLA